MFKSNVYFESKPKSIELVVERGLHNIILESDSLQTISGIRDASLNVSPLGPTIEDVKFLLTLAIEAIASYIRCQANSVAHRLARFALHSDGECCLD